MTTQTEALKLALEALEELNNTNSYWWQEVDEETVKKIKPAITAIKEALAQPAVPQGHKQEPVGHRDGYWCDDLTCKKCYSADFRFKHKNSVDKESLTTEAQQSGSVSNEQVEPKAWISWNRVSGESKLNYHKVVSHHDANLWQHFPLYTHPPVPTAQPKEPPVVAELLCVCGAEWEWRNRDWELISIPPQRKPLTDEEIRKAKHHMVDGAYQYSFMQGVRYAEAAHGIKE